MHPGVEAVTQRVIERSRLSRAAYKERMMKVADSGVARSALSCGNLAHGFAASDTRDKDVLAKDYAPNIAIVSSYNDMLSAHHPYKDYPDQIKVAAAKAGAAAQVAGGVPAMCDGVTQGRGGMELSLFSRDLIAMTTAIALSHDMFDAVLLLGVCDKIVPGLLMGALSFGHLPAAFVPAGPMPTGSSNAEKVRVRQLYAEGKVGRGELLASESASYHSPGTCTFYGTANSNQMVMEVMGLHLPGSSFVNPGTPLREALTRETVHTVLKNTRQLGDYLPLAEIVDERAIVNAVIALLATGGSTNHTIHLIAMAAQAGVQLTWEDMAALSDIIPLLARVYPNGQADVNHFHAAGGVGLVVRELLDAGLLHDEVNTILGRDGLRAYCQEAFLDGDCVKWKAAPTVSHAPQVIASVDEPFSPEGGLKLLSGNIGQSVIKISAVKPEHRKVIAPARVYDDQDQVLDDFKAGLLEQDFIAVLRFQGPKANGMPELHKLTPSLGVLQDRGFKVALVTDGRMSGASGKVPAAIHVSPEAVSGGMIAKLRDGDILALDAEAGTLVVRDEDAVMARDDAPTPAFVDHMAGLGRELFAGFRERASDAASGASQWSIR